MSDATILVSLGIFAVYMQRKKRWGLFWKALGGSYTISPLAGGSSSSSSTSTSSTSSTTPTVTGNGITQPLVITGTPKNS